MILHPRLRQVLDHRPQPATAPQLPSDAESALAGRALARFRTLSIADQRHLVATYWMLRAAGAAKETCIAGLLHDIGKSSGSHRASLTGRAVNVVMHRLMPARHRAWSIREHAPAPLRGVHLAIAHVHLGARFAHDCGFSDRVCWLIANHHEPGPQNDPELALLMAADDQANSSSDHYRFASSVTASRKEDRAWAVIQ